MDFGETFQEQSLEAKWRASKRFGFSIMESILEIALMMPAGSRMIIKVLGASQLMLNTFSPLMSSYTRWAAYKMPTASEASREWYLLLDRKRERKQPIVASRL